MTALADSIGVTKSFISRVNAGTRSLALDHLAKLETVVGEPLPLMLMQAIPREAIGPALLPYDASIELLQGKTTLAKRKQRGSKRTSRSAKNAAWRQFTVCHSNLIVRIAG